MKPQHRHFKSNCFYRIPPVAASATTTLRNNEKGAKFSNKSLVPKNLLTRNLADYLLTELFLFEIKQKNSSCFLNAENTVAFASLEPPNEDLHSK